MHYWSLSSRMDEVILPGLISNDLVPIEPMSDMKVELVYLDFNACSSDQLAE